MKARYRDPARQARTGYPAITVNAADFDPELHEAVTDDAEGTEA